MSATTETLSELRAIRGEVQAIRECLEATLTDKELYVKIREPYRNHYKFVTLEDYRALCLTQDKSSRQ